jgi:hypothetical protein
MLYVILLALPLETCNDTWPSMHQNKKHKRFDPVGPQAFTIICGMSLFVNKRTIRHSAPVGS